MLCAKYVLFVHMSLKKAFLDIRLVFRSTFLYQFFCRLIYLFSNAGILNSASTSIHAYVWFYLVKSCHVAYSVLCISYINVIQTVSNLISEAKWPHNNKPKTSADRDNVDNFI